VPLPIVLLHGAAGFDDIGPIDYFSGVQNRLRLDGYQAFTTAVSPVERIEVRAAQLAVQIEAIRQITGAARVHLIAHDQGGLDARYLISKLDFGDRVATLTTIGTPHHGLRTADIALGLVPGPVTGTLDALIDLLFNGNQNLEGQLYQLTEQYAEEEFNVEVLDDSRVSYYSVAGVTNALTLDLFNQDLCNPLLLPTLLLTTTGPSDGLVTVQSATYGELLGLIPADHFDEIGQFLGLSSLAFNHLAFYSRLGRFLTNLAAPSPL
jgi:triacylglycerol esterase/lipase EstA (alpha/beta hydrolase family)